MPSQDENTKGKLKIKAGQMLFIGIVTDLDMILMLTFYFINLKSSVSSGFMYFYLSALFGAILLFLGWTIPNHFEFTYRRKNSYYSGDLPFEIKEKKFSYRFPLISAGIIALIISSIFYLLY